jgi:hypothetical protein
LISREYSEPKDVLLDFLKDIEKIKSIRKNMSAPQMTLTFTVADRMPIFDASTFTAAPDSAWEKDDAYTWIYGATRYHPLMRRMGPSRPLPSFYSQPIQPLFEKWLEKILDVQNIPNYCIPDPLGGEKVHAYLERLQSILIHEKEGRKIW